MEGKDKAGEIAHFPETAQFSLIDYVIFGAMLCVSSGIGLYFRFTGGRQRTSEEYLLGDKSMSMLPVAFSLMASFMSSITLLGVSAEIYTFGTQFVAINFAYILGTPVAAYLYLPVFHRLQSPSAYEYLERRFGKPVRLAASLAFSLQMILYMGIVLYAPALALAAVTGLSKLGSILAVGVVCTFYSTLGGMKAVLITDVFQSLLMFAAIFSVIIVGAIEVGGLGVIFERAIDGGRFEFFNITPDPTERHTMWTQIIGGFFIYSSIYCVNQAQVQRLLSIGSLKEAQLSLWVQWPILTLLSLSTSLAGLTMYAYYQHCDPVQAGRIAKGDQLLPLFVIDTMGRYPGLPGLFVSGIFSGSLSTVSSAINSLAAVTVEDYIKPCFKANSTFKSPMLLKILALGYGLLCIALTFLVDLLGPGVLQASLAIFGIVGGPLLGLFTLGMISRKANIKGAITGFVTSLALLFWIGFGYPKPRPQPLPIDTDECLQQAFSNSTTPTTAFNATVIGDRQPGEEEFFFLYKISYAWYAMLGFLCCLLIGLLVSCITNSLCKTESPVNPELLWSFGFRENHHQIPAESYSGLNDLEKRGKMKTELDQEKIQLT